MNVHRTRRLGGALLLVVVSMALVLGMVGALTAYSVRAWERGKAERLNIAVRAAADSVEHYVRLHMSEWRDSPPAVPIQLKVGDLLPQGATGVSVLEFDSSDSKLACRVTVTARQGVLKAVEKFEVRFNRRGERGRPVP